MANEIKDLSASPTAPAADGRIPWQNLDGEYGSATPAQIAGAGAEVDWGQIGGDITDQTDLQSALGDKADDGDVTASGLTMATARLLGRTTASTGAVEEITVGSGLSLSGGALTATGGGGGGDGDVVGPDGGVADAEIAVYDGTTGKIIKGSGGATVAALESATTTAAGTATWGSVSGTLSNQTDLQSALDLKADTSALTDMVTAPSALALGNVVVGGGFKIAGDSSVAAADLVTAGATLTSGNLLTGAGGKGAQDASILAANVVTAAATLTDDRLVSGAGSKAAKTTTIDPANVVTAAANLTDGTFVVGSGGAKGVGTSTLTPAGIRHAPSHKFTLRLTTPDVGGPDPGEVYLHEDPAEDDWANVQYISIGPVDADGFRPPVADAIGELAGALVTVSQVDMFGGSVWATWEVVSVTEDEGTRITVGDLVDSQGGLGDLGDAGATLIVSILPLGGDSAIATPGTEGQVALFDGDGKLIGSSMVVVSGEDDTLDLGSVNESIIRIGNATTPTITLGPSGGGGSVTVHSNATFNGALRSPGTGTNSTKIGPGAQASGNEGIAIGLNASAGGAGTPRNVVIGAGSSSGNGMNVLVGANSSIIGNLSVIVGSSSSLTTVGGDRRCVLLGNNNTSAHPGTVLIGSDLSSTANNDFVLGNAANNYKLPGTIVTDVKITGTLVARAALATVDTSTYTLLSTDNGKILLFTHADGCAVTLPNDMPVGYNVMCVQKDADDRVTFTADTGATLIAFPAGATRTTGQNAKASLFVESNSGGSAAVWSLDGSVEAP
jgi:trimeric autotransporter adhesin